MEQLHRRVLDDMHKADVLKEATALSTAAA
jgi:hypothetical protein